jgi:protein-S-isoprenylcysteine O-methyltransferase Ste14
VPYAAALYLGAGTWRWPRAWVLLGVLFVTGAISRALLRGPRADLLDERAKGPVQSGQSFADRILLASFMASYAAMIAFAAADMWRFHLLPPLPTWARVLGLGAFIVGTGLVHNALRANTFASTVVRLQEERGHSVVREGPYEIVRHPMYAGVIPIMLGAAAWLGSAAAMVAGVVPTAILCVRIVLEERMLRARLPGYEQYTRDVRWRLVPGIW